MSSCAHSGRFFANRKSRRERLLRKLANMRAAKARRRQERVASGLLVREPKLERWFPLELGVRDKTTGETAWIDLRSGRDAARRLGVVLKLYQPGNSLRGLSRIHANVPIGKNSR